MKTLAVVPCRCQRENCKELFDPPSCLSRLARYGKVDVEKCSCTTGKTYHFEGICLLCAGKTVEEIVFDHVAEVKFKLRSLVMSERYALSSFQEELAHLLLVSDATNTEIIFLNWREPIETMVGMANAAWPRESDVVD